MGYPHASVLAWPSLFACLMLQVATHAFARAEQASNGIQASQQASIQLTFSKQAATAIRLEARTAPLGQILKAIADKTGSIIHYSVLPEPPVTATCVGANVGQIMDCLVAKQVGLVAHKSQKNKPSEFWLLGSSVGSCQAVTVAASPMPNLPAVVPQPTPEQQAEKDRMIQEQTERLLKQSRSKDPNQRAEAIGNLGSVGLNDDPNIEEALQNAMSDQDSSVREQALKTLVKRGGDVDSYLSQALKDNDSNVRFAAVSDIKDDVILLQQARHDSDPSVRNLAKSKLESLAVNGYDRKN